MPLQRDGVCSITCKGANLSKAARFSKQLKERKYLCKCQNLSVVDVLMTILGKTYHFDRNGYACICIRLKSWESSFMLLTTFDIEP